MSNPKAFIHTIKPVGTSDSESNSTHQVSPTWVVTFIRWSVRDTLRTPAGNPNSVRKQLVVENDCLAVSTADSKATLTPTVSITLIETDVNYATAVAPGDFIFVNMLNSEVSARKVADKARAGAAINRVNDGFKGIFKVQGVRKSISVDPSGKKQVLYKINGYAFTELNNTIYFNPYMLDQRANKNTLLFASFIGRDWTQLVNANGLTNVQDIIKVLIESFIGSGIAPDGRLDLNGTVKSPNVHFFLPLLVGRLMGIDGDTLAAKDLFVYLFGIQRYAGTGQSLEDGFNPVGLRTNDRFLTTSDKVQGETVTKPEYWNQVKTWSILNQFVNSPLNELYTAFRLNPDGLVMPTIVLRQTPFTTESYAGTERVTKFMNLPRWQIPAALIYETDIGREEAARINFVQVFGRSSVTSNGSDLSLEIAKGNYVYDIGDVQRSGLRPYIITSNYDEVGANVTDFRSPGWAKIIGDAVIGSHLKLNGTISCVGIVEPIAVGDNLEFDGVVFHIETISHQCVLNTGNGIKEFRTSIGLSSGMQATTAEAARYGEMTNADGYGDRQQDFNNLGILPGISESQDTVYRPDNLDFPAAQPSGFTQPGVKKVETGE